MTLLSKLSDDCKMKSTCELLLLHGLAECVNEILRLTIDRFKLPLLEIDEVQVQYMGRFKKLAIILTIIHLGVRILITYGKKIVLAYFSQRLHHF